MLKLLVKKQLTEIFRAYLYDAKKNRARSKAATVGYIIFFVLLMVGVIGGMFTVLSLTMCRSMAEAGMSWFYFAIMGLMAILLGAFGSVFTTYSSLYLPKDNDQMLSLPIPVNTLIAARLLGVCLMGLMYSGVVVLPAIIVYWATVSAAPLHLLAGVLFLLLISLFVMAISCLLGWVVAKVSLKLKNKSFVTVVLSLVFFGLYYYFFSFKANSLLTELLQNIALYGDKVRSSAYPVYLFGQGGRRRSPVHAASDGGHRRAVRPDVAAALPQLPLHRHGLRPCGPQGLPGQGRPVPEHFLRPAGPGAAPLHLQRQLYAQLRLRHTVSGAGLRLPPVAGPGAAGAGVAVLP